MKRILLAVCCVLVFALAGAFVWARAVLSGDAVRAAVERQLSSALSQPVTIRAARAGIWPRVTLKLDDVTIGNPAKISIRQLDVGASLRALISRRVEHGSLKARGARITLPLPAVSLTGGPSSGGQPPPVQIVSIDTIQLEDVEIVSGGRTLRGDVDIQPRGAGLEIQKITLKAEQTELSVSGTIANLTGPSGSLSVKARGVDLLEVVAFVTDFTRGAGVPLPGATRDVSPMHLNVDVDAGRTVAGTLVLENLKGVALVTPAAITLNPVTFNVFGGGYTGTLRMMLGKTPSFSVNASVKDVDVAKAMTFAGSPNTLTGRLHGSLVVSGRGTSADDVMRTARGTARVEAADGTVTGLDLVRAIVVAGSGRADSPGLAAFAKRSGSEPFSRLGGSFAIGEGVARTTDLHLESKDVQLSGGGDIQLLETSVAVKGIVQLSEELTKQAGQDLVRYTAENGKVTLPVTVTGPPGKFAVRPDMNAAARRALSNQVSDGMKSLFKRIIK